jgi:FkbM family methyltransferase
MPSILRKSPVRFVKRWLVDHHDRIQWCIPDRYFVFSVPGGKIYLNIKESSMMLERCFWLYEPEKTRAIQSLFKSGRTFVDVGGNKGDFALLAARIAGPSGKVVCVEPEPTNFQWISRSAELNGYKNIQLCNLALSDKDGEAVLHLGAKSGFHTLLDGAPERDRGLVNVETRTLDGLLAELKIPTVNVLKIDVEGAELQVLRGATATIATNPKMVILLDVHPFLGVNVAEVFDLLQSLGMRVCQMRPPYTEPAVPTQDTYDVVARTAS